MAGITTENNCDGYFLKQVELPDENSCMFCYYHLFAVI